MDGLTPCEVSCIVDSLNNRPRKCQGFITPTRYCLGLIHRLHLRVEYAIDKSSLKRLNYSVYNAVDTLIFRKTEN